MNVSPTFVAAHSKLTVPKPNFANVYGTVAPSGYIDGPSVLQSSMSFALQPERNARTFAAAFQTSQYKSLRELVLQTYTPEPNANKECGVTSLEGGTAQPLPDYVEWQTIDASHHGPCEVWCDDALAYHNDDCLKAFPTGPHRLPYDKTKCTGAKRLQAIWLAVHFSKWQVYINCATLGGSGGDASTSKDASVAPSSSSASPATGSGATRPSTPTPWNVPAPAAMQPSAGVRGWQDAYRNIVSKYAPQATQDWTKMAGGGASKNLRQ